MKSVSIQARDLVSLKNQIKEHITSGFQPTLAIAFCTPSKNIEDVCALFDSLNIDYCGCTTAGEICNTQLQEGSMAVLMMDMKKENFEIFFQDTGEDTTYQTAYNMGVAAKETYENPALIIMSGGLGIDAEQIVFGMKDAVGKEIPAFGGLAGDDLQIKETLAFANGQITTGGLASIILNNDRISIEGMATSGWEAIGTVHTITKAEGNVVYEINNEPALDVFIRYFGFFDNTRNGEKMSTLSAQYPLQILKDAGHSVLRSPMGATNEDKSLVLFGGVKKGDKFRFSISPGFEIINQTIKEFEHLKQHSQEVDAIILFSCKGRHAALGPLIDDEIQGIYQHWNKPMIGFLSYGEIGNVKNGQCEFHNETCSLVLIHEKDES